MEPSPLDKKQPSGCEASVAGRCARHLALQSVRCTSGVRGLGLLGHLSLPSPPIPLPASSVFLSFSSPLFSSAPCPSLPSPHDPPPRGLQEGHAPSVLILWVSRSLSLSFLLSFSIRLSISLLYVPSKAAPGLIGPPTESDPMKSVVCSIVYASISEGGSTAVERNGAYAVWLGVCT